jgi:hypothetical protein
MGFENIPPHSGSKHSITFHNPLVIGSKQTSPLEEKILEVLIAYASCMHFMIYYHFVLGVVEKMVEQMLLPHR